MALISVLSIMIVLFIAVSNVEEAPIRRPFPTQGAEFGDNMDKKESVFSRYNSSGDKDQDTAADFEGNFSNFVEKVEDSNGSDHDSPEIEFGNTVFDIDTQFEIADPDTGNVVKPISTGRSGDLALGINSELLDKAGFRNFFIKPRPFDGLLFESFDVSMLTYLNVLDRKIIQLIDGNEVEILRIYEFNLNDVDASDEIYTYLKTSLKDQLGVSVNETNQFGMGSFFINHQVPRNNAFLVVKTRGNVYALSYPKTDEGNINYFELVSNLFSELI